MPNYGAHVWIGAVVAGGVFFLLHKSQDQIPFIDTNLSILQWAVLIGAVYFFTIMPDIDHQLSYANKIWITAAGLLGIYSLWTGQLKTYGLAAIASILILEYVRHRGFTHDLWFIALMAAPLWFIHPVIAITSFVAGSVHVIIDGDLGK